MKKNGIQLAVVILLGIVLWACNVKTPEPTQLPTKEEASRERYVDLEELYEDIPNDITDKSGWERWADK